MCEVSVSMAGCMSVVCTMQQCAVDLTVLQELEHGSRSGLYSWQPANSSVMWGATLLQVITNNLGTLNPSHATEGLMSPVQFSYSPSSLPVSFMWSSTWPGLMSGVERTASECGSWSVTAVSVLGDRMSLARGRRVELDTESLGCGTGSVGRAWRLLRYESDTSISYRQYHQYLQYQYQFQHHSISIS